MTALPDPLLPAPGPTPLPATVTLPVEGDLDHESCDTLLATTTAAMSTQPAGGVVRLDCTAMTMCDSMGLSTLLQIRRRTDAAGILLLIDHRPAVLDRLLHLTGTFDHLVRRSAVRDDDADGA
ncbi:STAS domain-containing protein [Kitasatospora purpeofusca]|uniref:STAS domain-containing protein n=1 Tax=Kitasatospora purpeofusca TaxID=67352 RepID=UPI00369E4E9A